MESADKQIPKATAPKRYTKAKTLVWRFVQALCITLLAFALSLVMMQPFSFSAATLMSSNEGTDFNITDFYNIIADSRAMRMVDRDITIVDVSGATRDDLADVLMAMPELKPRAVGLDVMFDKPHDDDSYLFKSIDANPDMVMLVDVAANEVSSSSDVDKAVFHLSDSSFFHERIAHYSFGASNLVTARPGGVVREFRPYYPLAGGDTIPAFAVAVAEKVDGDAVAELQLRAKTEELISYPSRSFRVVPWQEIYDKSDLINDHIILIGDTDNAADKHATPADHSMPGVIIHAHALSTILDGDYFLTLPHAWNIIIAFVLCFLLAWIHTSLPIDFKALVLRFVQVGLLYIIIVVGYNIFIDFRIVINFSYTLLMLTFLLFACDLWLGGKAIIKRIIARYRSK